MKLLVLSWGAYTQADIDAYLKKKGITYNSFYYCFGDKNTDAYFERHFEKVILEGDYDAVFSVNFFPLPARVCHKLGVKYLSWSYDNPLNVPNIEDTLWFPTNYVFLFDRIQTKGYLDKGFDTVYHLPLAINTEKMKALSLTQSEIEKYSSEISFVGKIYPSVFRELLGWVDDYNNGFLTSIEKVQSQIYGSYIIDRLLTDSVVADINRGIQTKNNIPDYSISKEQLSYAIASNITREERLTLLNLLSRGHQVSLYSFDTHPLLSQADFKGPAEYSSEMYRVFKASRVNLNITLKILQSGIPLRVLDILGAGGFLLTNYQEEIAENFENEKDVVIYDDIADAVEKADFYLKHEELRSQIAVNGHLKALENFSYDIQFEKLFKAAGLL